MGMVRMRVRHPNGTLQVQVEDSWTAVQLLEHLRSETGIQYFTLKEGFPPKALDLSDSGTTLGSLGLNGSAITLTPADPPAETADQVFSLRAPEAKPDNLSVRWPEMDGCMVLRVMADDNSCLFTALSGSLATGIKDPAPYLRNQIAEYILAHPETYNKATLEKTPEQYVRNLRGKDFWGGSIEISVLSDIYDIQIVAVDVKTNQTFKHGEDKSEQCLVLYSGIHYDRIVFACSPDYPPDADITRFPVDDESVIEHARELAEKLRQSGYFTDTNTMVVQCLVPGCDWLGDVKSANDHSKATGHQAFDEIPDSS
ncbi:ubiquitin thioesterase OTU1 [Magnaporthiopsis poae ATCC 64411]|uniref:Ubiquitin thioesterase OTU n=1 Tax=Magnaporthiopsis poae (strain ATCC 64411 / 73-15) TaxID=644358 RepID=A0A0C4DUC0_MAGP6|nr:ubiquitin thioesterase OTU1 [Magnaporthiopsis poae ATCC 64411]